MRIRMVALHQDKVSGSWFARKAIPADVRGAYKARFGKGHEELFRASPAVGKAQAQILFAEWLARVESQIKSVRDEAEGRGQGLTEREAYALAGEWYLWFVKRHEAEPGDADKWHLLMGDLRDAQLLAMPKHVDERTPIHELKDLEAEPEVRRATQAFLSDSGQVMQFLVSQRLTLSPVSLSGFLDKLEPEFYAACELLARRAQGDFRPDNRPAQFAKWDRSPRKSAGYTAWALFEAWIAEAKPGAATVTRWRAVFLYLKKAFGDRDASSLTADDATSWARGLLNENRSGRTINEVYLSATKTVFGWAVKARIIDVNPFKDVSVPVRKTVANREGRWLLISAEK